MIERYEKELSKIALRKSKGRRGGEGEGEKRISEFMVLNVMQCIQKPTATLVSHIQNLYLSLVGGRNI
jgi:hypothetical protein